MIRGKLRTFVSFSFGRRLGCVVPKGITTAHKHAHSQTITQCSRFFSFDSNLKADKIVPKIQFYKTALLEGVIEEIG